MSNLQTISWSASADEEEVCLCGVGARTPLGFNAAASAAAVRGGISALEAHPVFVDKDGEPIALARDAGLELDLELIVRMKHLLVSAMTQALADVLPRSARSEVQCWIGLPESRPGLPREMDNTISVALLDAFPFAPSTVHMLACGHAAGLMSIQMAARQVSTGATEFCVAAGVDSYHDLKTLIWLDRSGALMSPRNRNGFPPGEGAAACVLAKRSTANLYGLPIMARIVAAATAVEPNSIRSSEVCIGEGLSAALKGVLCSLNLPLERISSTWCDLNGQRYRNEEFLYTLLRVQDGFVDPNDYRCPADCWGDVGAASGLLYACLAVASYQRGYAAGSHAALWASSESGYRAAIILKLGDS